MKKYLLSKKHYVVIIAVIAIIALLVFLSGGSKITDEIEIEAVTRGEVKEIVSETGFVQPTHEVNLAFEYPGRVTKIAVQEGNVVEEDTILVELDSSERRAQLTSANAQLFAAQVRLEELIRGADNVSLDVTESAVDSAKIAVANAKSNLENVTTQQNQLVENARRTLMTSSLQAYLTGDPYENSNYSFTQPTITGTYTSDETGSYFLDIYNSSAQSGASFRLSGLEAGTQTVSTNNAIPLGTRGLYVQFPEDFARGSTIVWEVPIPNNRSSLYLTNLNAYNAVLEARDVAIESAANAVKTAEATLEQLNSQYTQVSSSARNEQVDAQRAVVQQTQAGVDSARIAFEKMTLRAPFKGIVTDISVDVGQIVAPAVPVVMFISDENFELIANISESDIQEISIGDTATVIFDAYDDERFKAVVTEISPTAEILDGIRAFKVTLKFEEKNEHIRSGLSADIDIIAAERSGVLVVPTRAVVEREDGKFVRALNNGSLKYIPVQTGLRGSDGMTEIISGLEEGTEVITFANESAIKSLEGN